MTSVVVIIGALIYIVAYFTYGKMWEKKVVKADPNRVTPANRLNDGVDYYPAKTAVLYGHHFASIAGAGPILGPAIAMAWGWLPSLLWVWFGNIFIGSIHDYMALMASVRYDGKSIQWVAGKIISKRTGYSFELFIYVALLLVIAAFAAVAAKLFVKVPASATISMLFILVALITGFMLYKTKLGLVGGTIVGLILLIGAIWFGFYHPWKLPRSTWLIILLIYIIIASSLPVWVLLQPRDYLNAYLLWTGLIMGGLAIIITHHGFNWASSTMFSPNIIGGQPSPFWPTVPLIIACGSLSGFHSIVASGTSSKQLDKETHGLIVGYAGMFTEGFLSTIVIASIGAFGFMVLSGVAKKVTGLHLDLTKLQTDPIYLGHYYLKAASAVGGALGMFVASYGKAVGAGLGIPAAFGKVFGALWVTAFILTTLDTSTRLARFAWAEIWEPIKKGSPALYKAVANRWVGSAIAAILGVGLAASGSYLVLWPAFSGANQMLASIAMITAAVWVRNILKAKKAYQYAILVPAFFPWITVTVALIWYLIVVVPVLKSAIQYPVGGFTVLMLILNFLLISDFTKAMRKNPDLEPIE
ncbi:MAG: carbon starvation protein A [Synergistetes bacterium]|nr:carbon starvation protein A [Synergistota bacterium]